MDVNPKSRRRHTAEFKAQVVAACAEPGVSVAAVARAFGLNDNLVHDWRRGRSGAGKPAATSLQESSAEFIALSLPSPPAASVASTPAPSRAPAASAEAIRLEFKRGAIGVSVTWPVCAAADCAAWLREVLR
ncbi:transposase [Variovorax sp. ZS18.2.2]|uniref:IS66-like element accessory protein TnpA n=1 Tax=Variovorax sp. ZS18.2.2 TaxID=2971255 RepID=UPI0021510459|nr:transposase [Variovorax sp. ZS18.2.2]MCR6478422.1 transposase [Variovorax sp. ZS18.2.2]